MIVTLSLAGLYVLLTLLFALPFDIGKHLHELLMHIPGHLLQDHEWLMYPFSFSILLLMIGTVSFWLVGFWWPAADGTILLMILGKLFGTFSKPH